MHMIVLLLLPIIFASPSPFRTATLKDDAYHFQRQARHDLWYVEWWYFNFECENDLSGIYVYGTWNPSDRVDLGFSILYALHYKGTSVQHTSDLHEASKFSASYEQADVTIDEVNTIRVIDKEKYSVIGTSADKTASWNFNVSGIVEPWFFYDNSSVGPSWQQLSWLVYMPRARVSGSVFFEGETHQLSNCDGYHDHDWGRWDSFVVTWAWLQYSNENITIVAGAGRETGYDTANNLWVKTTANEEEEELFVKFTSKECSVQYSNFVKSDIPLHKFPSHAHYACKSPSYEIDLTYDVIVSPGIWKAAVVVFEQKSHFEGVLRDVASGKTVSQFKGVGFSEWTDYLP